MTEGGAICYVTSVSGNYWDKYSKEFQLFTRAKTWEEMKNVLEYQAKEEAAQKDALFTLEDYSSIFFDIPLATTAVVEFFMLE